MVEDSRIRRAKPLIADYVLIYRNTKSQRGGRFRHWRQQRVTGHDESCTRSTSRKGANSKANTALSLAMVGRFSGPPHQTQGGIPRG